jgi:hypothetical protein
VKRKANKKQTEKGGKGNTKIETQKNVTKGKRRKK